MNDLARQHCKALEGGSPLSDDAVAAHLADAAGWSLVDGAIEKRYGFGNYYQTMAFVNAVAWIAHTEDHHPELAVSYDHCVARYSTHSVGGISVNDFICAAKIDALRA